MSICIKKTLFPLLAMTPVLVYAGEVDQQLLRCSALGDASTRLSCYDALAKASAPVEADVSVVKPQPSSSIAAPIIATVEPAAELSRVVQQWELDDTAKRGRFVLRPYRDNYLLIANYSNSSNDQPFQNFTPAGVKSKHVELTYQLSAKMKVAEGIRGAPVDLWVAYTQQSFWQAYNRSASSPFRETNYQPEAIAVVPLNKSIGNLDVHYLNFGIVHQSNGQTSTLSRSWNRLYAELGIEYNKFALSTRLWRRLDNAKSDNDNIDITDYMGHGDIRATYRDKNGQEFSVMARRNFSTGRGAIQAGWVVPITANLKSYAQIFSGYGQSLIDYNYSQKSIGGGFMMDF